MFSTPEGYKLDNKPATFGNLLKEVADPVDQLGGTMKAPVLCNGCQR